MKCFLRASFPKFIILDPLYSDLGCWEGYDDSDTYTIHQVTVPSSLDSIADPVRKCYESTVKLGFNTFGINIDRCKTSATAENTYKKLGKADTCRDNGRGGAGGKNQVYKINRKLI